MRTVKLMELLVLVHLCRAGCTVTHRCRQGLLCRGPLLNTVPESGTGSCYPNAAAYALHDGLLTLYPHVTVLPECVPEPLQSQSWAFTILEDPLHVEPIGGARLIVCAPLQVIGELPSPDVIDDPWVGGTYGICNRQDRVLISNCFP